MSYNRGGRGRGGYGGGGGHYGGGGRGGPSSGSRSGPKDVEFLAELFDRETRDDSAVTCMALEPASNLVFVGYKSGVVRQWECSDWANANTNNWRVKNSVPMNTGGPVTALHIVGDPNAGGFLFVGCMTVREVQPGKPPAPAVIMFFSTAGTGTLNGHAGKIDTITSGGQAQYLLWSGGVDKTIRGWLARPEAGTFDQQVQFDCGFGVTKLEVVGDLLLSADTQGNVSVWHVPNKMRVQEFRAHEKAISGLLFAEGHLFTASLDKRLRIWGFYPEAEWGMNQVIRSQGAVMEQPGHGQGSRKEYEMVVTMALMKDPHQRHVALASYTEGVVRIFRPEEGRFKNNGFIKDYSMGRVICAGPANSGYFMIGSEKGRVQIWRFRADVVAEEMDG